jgi:hypothetical protein
MNPNLLVVLTLISLKSTNLQVIKQVAVEEPIETLATVTTSTTTKFPFEVNE